VSLTAGEQLGPYRIIAAIGAGGMGEVFRARDTRLEREVAVKILPAAFSSDAERRKRFLNEIRAVGALSHPNILVVHDTGEHQGAPFLVMELLEGATLRERLREGPIPPRKAVEWAAQLARGVAAAHDAGVIHRDLKPENVFLTRQGVLKVLDFGIAHLERAPSGAGNETASALTASGAVLGTAGYMAPEQVRGGTLDLRADIFAFGAVVYEMLTGQRAFPGETGVDRGHAILNLDPPNLHSLVPGLSPATAALVARCLEKDPSQRFQSMRDVGFALEAVREPTGVESSLAARRGEGCCWREPWESSPRSALESGSRSGLGRKSFLPLRSPPSSASPSAGGAPGGPASHPIRRR
jgi:eukaryotic-like serine/threonine-protein kinase